jgi:hypothetical protein
MRFQGHIPWGCSLLLPKRDAFFFVLCSWTFLHLWNCWTWDFVLVLQRPIEITPLIGNWPFATFKTYAGVIEGWQRGS